MLLLVLILVVIAFGLLVVALLSGSVLWAWVSVGVSVVAAVVLLVDWLQRRAAVKAGAAPAVEPAAGAPAPLASPPMGFQPGTGRPPMADMDPATEVLPVVPPSSLGGDETVVAQAPKQSDARRSDAQQTVVMPAVQPSGSPARPSGADPTLTSSSAISSPTVTGGEADRSDPGFGTGDARPPSAAEGAVVADRTTDDEPDEKSPSLQKPPSLTKEGLTKEGLTKEGLTKEGLTKEGLTQEGIATDGKSGDEAAAEKAGDAAAGASPGSPAPVGTAAPGSAAPGTAGPGTAAPGTAGPETAGPETAGPETAGPGTGAAAPEPTTTEAAAGSGTSPSGSDAESTVKVEAHTKAPAEPTVSAPAAEDVDLFGAAPARQPVEQEPVAQTPPAQIPPAQTPPAQTPPAQPPIEEAPEEPRDAGAAEIVGKLDDEVVVVDEQPRYHVSECRALVAVAVIPLPVREAVELGFTPCGWCSPDRTLAGRHQTASR